jgi:hypothetical protein
MLHEQLPVILAAGNGSRTRHGNRLTSRIRQGDNPLAETFGLRFVKLSRSDRAIDYVEDDLRGRAVLTIEDDRIGIIDDLLMDTEARRVCFFDVRSDGILGIGERRSLIPLEAMRGFDEQWVFVEHSSDHVSAAPMYNPHVAETIHYLNEVYEHYGYAPRWAPGVELT